jgi:hypothetical protein
MFNLKEESDFGGKYEIARIFTADSAFAEMGRQPFAGR